MLLFVFDFIITLVLIHLKNITNTVITVVTGLPRRSLTPQMFECTLPTTQSEFPGGHSYHDSNALYLFSQDSKGDWFVKLGFLCHFFPLFCVVFHTINTRIG